MTVRAELLPTPIVDDDGRPICELCKAPLRPDEPGVLSLIIGFVKAREGGGAHGVTERRDLGVYRHSTCHRFGRQESLL